MDKEQKYIDFVSYERVAEPHKRERVSAWRTAIGLQDVDGLRVSDYLKKIAVKHIEGDITIDEVREQLQSYYVNKTTYLRVSLSMLVRFVPMTSVKRNGYYKAIQLYMVAQQTFMQH